MRCSIHASTSFIVEQWLRPSVRLSLNSSTEGRKTPNKRSKPYNATVQVGSLVRLVKQLKIRCIYQSVARPRLHGFRLYMATFYAQNFIVFLAPRHGKFGYKERFLKNMLDVYMRLRLNLF